MTGHSIIFQSVSDRGCNRAIALHGVATVECQNAEQRKFRPKQTAGVRKRQNQKIMRQAQ